MSALSPLSGAKRTISARWRGAVFKRSERTADFNAVVVEASGFEPHKRPSRASTPDNPSEKQGIFSNSSGYAASGFLRAAIFGPLFEPPSCGLKIGSLKSLGKPDISRAH